MILPACVCMLRSRCITQRIVGQTLFVQGLVRVSDRHYGVIKRGDGLDILSLSFQAFPVKMPSFVHSLKRVYPSSKVAKPCIVFSMQVLYQDTPFIHRLVIEYVEGHSQHSQFQMSKCREVGFCLWLCSDQANIHTYLLQA